METEATEQWAYMGRRRTASGKLVHVFAEDDERHSFTKHLGASVIGGRYDLTVVRDGDSVHVRGLALHDGPADISDELRLEWEADDRAAYQEQQRRQLHKRAANDQLLLQHVAAIRDAYGKVAPAQRAAFLGWLIQQVS